MTTQVTRWWWVRHAPVTANNGLIYGAEDLPCDTTDADAFVGLAKILPNDGTLVTSTLMRTHQTADAISAAGLVLPPRHEVSDLREQSFGDWQGKSFADLEGLDPRSMHEFWLCPAHHRPPSGESFVDLMGRVAPAIEAVSDQYGERDIIAVTHGGTIRAALAFALGLEPDRALGFSIDNLSVTRIDRIETGMEPGRPGSGRLSWRTVFVNRPPK